MKLGKRISVGEVKDNADQEPLAELPAEAQSTPIARVDGPPAAPVTEPVVAHAER